MTWRTKETIVRHFDDRTTWPRRGEPWSPAEDRALLRAARKLKAEAKSNKKKGKKVIRGWEFYEALGHKFGRTSCSISARLQILKVCQCHIRASKP